MMNCKIKENKNEDRLIRTLKYSISTSLLKTLFDSKCIDFKEYINTMSDLKSIYFN